MGEGICFFLYWRTEIRITIISVKVGAWLFSIHSWPLSLCMYSHLPFPLWQSVLPVLGMIGQRVWASWILLLRCTTATHAKTHKWACLSLSSLLQSVRCPPTMCHEGSSPIPSGTISDSQGTLKFGSVWYYLSPSATGILQDFFFPISFLYVYLVKTI